MLFRELPAAVSVMALLLSGLTGCDSPTTTRTATDPGTPPFTAANGESPATPGSVAVAKGAAAPTETGAPLPDSLHLISPGRAGRLRLGMTEKRLKNVVSADLLTPTTYQDRDGRRLPAYELRDAQHPEAPATILHLIGDSAGGFRVRRIRIYSSQYRTAEGIGVGSPFGAARQNLGLTRIRNTPAGLAAVSGEVQLAWVIDPNSLPNKPPEQIQSSEIPPAARITGVLLYK
ncbi:hypothetical protein [Hymenobacter rigui]|uniref:Uncharacterized protein n=1 Tax=Hymenobacter rigui TaxID=334424 RepID=A0A428KC24_9BACT|nr:hypothetical protein [Hymenobacter rigui]RSK43972.1 hypothetical protein EI291_20455 [Hymenobacter rigui]